MYVVCWIGASGAHYARSKVFFSVKDAQKFIEITKKSDEVMGIEPDEYKIFKLEEVKQ